MPVIYTHQRPGPTTPHQSSTKLHPIYQALDSYNYTKALKLTAEGSGGGNNKGGDDSDQWDIVRTLRVHALERCGKVRESLVLLWEILVVNVVFDDESEDDGSSSDVANKPQEIWSELYSRIESLSTIEDMISNSSVPLGLENIQLVNATQRLDRKVYVPIALPTKKESSTTSSSQAAAAAAVAASSNNKLSSKSKSKKGSNKSKSKKNTATSTTTTTTSSAAAAVEQQRKLPPITDESTLSTIAVTLRTLQMYDTLSIMYNMAIMEYYTNNNNNNSKRNNEEEENLRNILEEGVCIHFKAVCDCSSVVDNNGSGAIAVATTTLDTSVGESKTTTNNMEERIVQCQLLKLETLHKASTYYERMQSCKFYISSLPILI